MTMAQMELYTLVTVTRCQLDYHMGKSIESEKIKDNIERKENML